MCVAMLAMLAILVPSERRWTRRLISNREKDICVGAQFPADVARAKPVGDGVRQPSEPRIGSEGAAREAPATRGRKELESTPLGSSKNSTENSARTDLESVPGLGVREREKKFLPAFVQVSPRSYAERE